MPPLVAVGPGLPAGPSVVIRAAASPEAGTRVEVGGWAGPLGLLLSLIESRKLDVMTVPLGGLAEAYLDALAGLAGDRLGHISSFVAVAGQLILIKSRALLPRHDAAAAPAEGTEDEGDPEVELRERLLVYRAHRDAGLRLAAVAAERVGLFRREPAAALAAAFAGAAPADRVPLEPRLLTGALTELVQVIAPPEPPVEVLARVVTLAERAAVIRAAIRVAPQVILQELLRGVRDRVVAAVTFLALLELMKRREIVVDQAVPFGPIHARRTTAAERSAAGLAAEPGSDSLDESLASFA